MVLIFAGTPSSPNVFLSPIHVLGHTRILGTHTQPYLSLSASHLRRSGSKFSWGFMYQSKKKAKNKRTVIIYLTALCLEELQRGFLGSFLA